MPIDVDLRLIEPNSHASTNKKTMHTGRGGAGNTIQSTSSSTSASKKSSLSYVPTNTSVLSTASTKFHSGRGGAGNIHPISDESPYTFDDEVVSLSRREEYDSHRTYHVGRGGAGNWASQQKSAGRKFSSDSSSSSGSDRNMGLMRRLSAAFDR